jgi:hypothetical protein
VKRLASPHYLEVSATLRRWFFESTGDTARAFVLPPDAFVGELRLRYTLWAVAADPSLYQPHRLYPRVRGVAFGVEVGLDERSEARPWGARDPAAFSPPDLRNDPATSIVFFRQWLRAGAQLHPRLRLQLAEAAAFGFGEDDLTRLRVGGQSPYVVPVVGLPWAVALAGRLAAVDGSVHVRLWRELEAGLLGDAVLVDDRRRTGVLARPGVLGGIGVFADLRLGAWQLDVRGGWSPSFGSSWELFASLGWSLAH